MSFEYNDEGIRTGKTANGVEHIYYLNGSQIVAEEWSNKLLVYLYDANGSPIGMQYRTTSYAEGVFDTFWFEKNLQGDIIAVYNDASTLLATYSYDAWGAILSTKYSNGGSGTAATYNPFRYRGYYRDSETGFYYLNSRYYDPGTGRFLNADSYASTGQGLIGNNMYAYCLNNPVMCVDANGNWCYSYLNSESTEYLRIMSQRGSCGGGSVSVGTIPSLGISANDFSIGLITPDKYDMPPWLSVYALYVKGSYGFESISKDDFSIASIELGVVDMIFNTPKWFASLPADHLANPNIYAGVAAWKASASLGIGVSGIVEILSGTIGVQFGDAVSVEAKGYVGAGFTFDFSNGIKFGLGLGLGYEISINFDWGKLFG